MYFASYAENQEKLACLIDLGFRKILVEEPHFSLLCQRDAKASVDYSFLEKILKQAKEKNAQVFFHLDLLLHPEKLKQAIQLVRDLYSMGYDGIRLQDLGLAHWICEHLDKFSFEWNTITGNANLRAILFWERSFSPLLKGIVFSKEIPYLDLKEIQEASSLENEILVQGPILLFYTQRRLIRESEFLESAQVGENRYAFFLQEKKRPEEQFLFHDNTHGSFMFFSKELFLLFQIPRILDLGLSSLFFDFRAKSQDWMKHSVLLFQKAIEYTKKDTPLTLESLEAEVQEIYPKGFTEGFFEENTTDNHKHKKSAKDHQVLAKLLESSREKRLVLECLRNFVLYWLDSSSSLSSSSLDSKLELDGVDDIRTPYFYFQTPEGREVSYRVNWIRDLAGKEQREIQMGNLIQTNWCKGVNSGSLLCIRERD